MKYLLTILCLLVAQTAPAATFPVTGIGYVGEYITLAQPGTVATNSPVHIADCFSTSCNLPAGTFFVRRDGSSTSPLLLTGATVQSGATDTLALTASDTYIANYRQGQASVGGFSPGEKVTVSLKRLAFDWGGGTGGGQINDSTLAPLFVSNFNALTTAGGGYWADNEPTQGQVDLSALDTDYAFATAHIMHVRLHNGIWDFTQPSWVNTLLAQAGSGSSSAKSKLSAAITSRLNYLLTDPHAGPVTQFDTYDEQSSANGNNTCAQIYGPSGIAAIYNQAASLRPDVQMATNDGELFNGVNTQNYINTANSIINAGAAVGVLGIEDYNEPQDASITPSLIMQNIQSLNVFGKPEDLTEWGAFQNSTNITTKLNQAMRMMFGNPQSEGFFIWEWITDPNGWAAYSGLYTLTNGQYVLTPAGKVWRNQLGLDDPSTGWNTQLTATANTQGVITFKGFYGDYSLNGQEFNFAKGAGLAGDFNGDGRSDAADYVVWRDGLGGKFTQADYSVWVASYGRTVGAGVGSSVSESPSWIPLLLGVFWWWLGRRSAIAHHFRTAAGIR